MAIPPVPPQIPRELWTSTDALRYETPPPVDVTFAGPATPCIVVHPPATRKKKESLGWLASILIHAGLIVLVAMLLAPADLGGVARHVISLSFSSKDASDEGTRMLALEPDSSMSTQPFEAIDSAQLISTTALPDILNPSSLGIGSDSGFESQGNNTAGGGPHGSFYGINAQGHDFVYVIDVSGSMDGARYVRAAAELVKSVNQLQPNQRFYVMLFNDSMTQLFDETTVLPQPVAATRENKQRLEKWLFQVEPSGGTDPRVAIDLALRMNPGAVFILSDGEFRYDKKGRSKLFSRDANAFEIVENAGTNVALNAIAFEDPDSCRNMQRLASMTAGQYRFVEASGNTADALLDEAQAAQDAGCDVVATSLLRQVLAISTDSAAAKQAREELIRMHEQPSLDALSSNDLSQLVDALIELAKDDPSAEFTRELQEPLIAAITDRTRRKAAKLDENADPIENPDNESGEADEGADEYALLFGRFESVAQSYAAKQLNSPHELDVLAAAQKLEADEQYVKAFALLDEFIAKQGGFTVSTACDKARDRICDSMLKKARTMQQHDDAGECVLYLHGIINHIPGTTLAIVAKTEQKTILFRLMAEARQARLQHNFPLAKQREAGIEQIFDPVDDLKSMQSEFYTTEVTARRHLRNTQKIERGSLPADVVSQYRWIVDTYPYTLAAQTSRERLRDLGMLDDGRSP